ncbi:MAG: YafY family protein [Sporomusaceae bacterium]|nr:YafY family protein [Sporomusaceae bacterium]
MKIDRLIAMIMVLLERERVSARELAAMFEVSIRTIYRDLESINQAGIPVLATSGPGGGAEILKTYKVEKRLFSPSDITTLLMGLGSIQSTVSSNEIVATLAKVKGMIPPEKEKEFNFRANQIKIDMTPWLHAGGLSDRIETIKIALEQRCLLRFAYRDIRNQQSDREIEPYRLLLKGEDWYLQGYCLTRSDYRTFKLWRMQNICIVEQIFEIRDSAAAGFDRVLAIDKKVVPAKLRIHAAIRDTITARFGEDCLTPDGDDYYFADIHLPVDDLACRYLLSLGNQCICLEPEVMREKLRQLSAEIRNFY